MKTFVALAIVLSREGLAAYRANKWPLIGVSAEVRAQVVGSCKTFGTEAALERGGVLLHTFGPRLLALLWLGQAESKNVVGDGGG